MEDALLSPLLKALESDPDNDALRLHVGKVLMDYGRNEEARDHAFQVLARCPDDPVALELAASVLEFLNEPEKASRYRRILEALGYQTARRMVEGAIPSPISNDSDIGDGPESDEVEDEDEDFGYAEDRRWDAAISKVRLSDVAGMADVKRRLDLSFLSPLRNPEVREMYGKSLRGGLLLYGPPGCGKTYIAKALAGELGARFLAVGLNDVLDMWIGRSERNLHDLFQFARRNRPCVIFFDEIDALGRKRSLNRHSATGSVVNQLLAELDGVQSENEDVYVLAATNHPWDVDEALRRPGRLDRTVIVLPPDEEARAAIFEACTRERPREGLDYRALAAETADYSGADIAHLCDSAAELALEDCLRTGVARPIRMGDFKKVRKEVRPSVRPWLETAKNYALFANESGAYDDLLGYLRSRRMI